MELRSRQKLTEGLVTAATARKRGEYYQTFEDWMSGNLAGHTIDHLAREHSSVLVEWVAEFVLYCYTELGWSRTRTAEAVLAVTDRHPAIRQMLGGAWRLLRAWAITEPTDLHPPCPLRLLQAMVVSAIAWGWLETGATLLLGFFALLRPIEYLSVKWGDLVLPSSHCNGEIIYVGIPEHKTQRRGPRRTHVKIDHKSVVRLLVKLSRGKLDYMPIWSNSAHTWRRRLRLLCQNLTGNDKTILPSSLRPGGASHFFEAWGEDIPRLQWRGRWACQRTLEHYVQELMVHHVLRGVGEDNLGRMAQLASLFDAVLEEKADQI